MVADAGYIITEPNRKREHLHVGENVNILMLTCFYTYSYTTKDKKDVKDRKQNKYMHVYLFISNWILCK